MFLKLEEQNSCMKQSFTRHDEYTRGAYGDCLVNQKDLDIHRVGFKMKYWRDFVNPVEKCI